MYPLPILFSVDLHQILASASQGTFFLLHFIFLCSFQLVLFVNKLKPCGKMSRMEIDDIALMS